MNSGLIFVIDFVNLLYIQLKGGLVVQAVRRSPPTAGVPSLRLGDSMWVLWWTNFSQGFSHFPLPQISFHHFSTLISSISFHFISPCDRASGVVGRHPCYSRGFIASHPSARPCVGHELRIFNTCEGQRVNGI